jgi:transcription initiation factor TFIID subunit 3
VGYHSAKAAVLDSLTDLAARYMLALCQATAIHAAHNSRESSVPSIIDVRMALQDVGALLPERPEGEQEFTWVEDLRGVDEFIGWMRGPLNREIKRIALDGNDEADDYLNGGLPRRYHYSVGMRN